MWTNFPVSDVPRPGLRMGELSAAERDSAHGLLKSVLSPMGYQKVLDIMAADQTLDAEGTPYACGYNAYTIAMFGAPATSSPWMLQFGGHHLGLNVVFVGDKAVCATLHTGILPSKFVQNGKIIRGLGKGKRQSIRSDGQLHACPTESCNDRSRRERVGVRPRPNAKLAPQGLRGSSMSEQQQAIMFSLVSEWAGVLNDAHCAQRLEEIRRSMPDTQFAWSGPTTHEPDMNGESYFRLHGPNLLIEHAPQGNQGGYKLHVHTVMRD